MLSGFVGARKVQPVGVGEVAGLMYVLISGPVAYIPDGVHLFGHEPCGVQNQALGNAAAVVGDDVCRVLDWMVGE